VVTGQGKMVAIAIFSADPAMRRSLEQLPREDSTLSIVGVVDDPAAISLLIDQNHVNVILADVPLRERLGDSVAHSIQMRFSVHTRYLGSGNFTPSRSQIRN